MRSVLKISLVLAVMAVVSKSRGMDPWQQEMLDKENAHRANHKVLPLKYNEELASNAQKYAKKLAQKCVRIDHLEHSPDSGRMYKGSPVGENIWATYEKDIEQAPTAADDWYEEIEDYPWGTDFNGKNRPIHVGHFTQQIWKKNKEVGYGVSIKAGCAMYVVAHYYPGGNHYTVQRYQENVLTPIKAFEGPSQRKKNEQLIHMLGRYY